MIMGVHGQSPNTIYYVDSVAGSDDNPGTLELPWATVAKVNAASFSSGDSIGFKAGGDWSAETLVIPQNNLTFQIYGAGADPIIAGYDTNSKTGYKFTAIQFTTLTVGLVDSYFPSASTAQVIRYNSGNTSDGMPFLATATYILAQGLVALKKTGSPSGNLWMEVWTSAANLPVTKLATSRIITVDSLTTSFADYTFSFNTMPAITNNSFYALVIAGDFTISMSNYAQAGYNNTPGYTSGTNAAFDGSKWVSNASRPWRFKTFAAQ
jgi:hypothetical protein